MEQSKPKLITYINSTDGRKRALYLCGYCNNEFVSRVDKINSGHTKSCGCKKIKDFVERNTVHNLSKHRIYKIRNLMIQRCENTNNTNFINYGKRGINVCNEWKNDFMSFYDWSMSNGYEEHLTIDRINNDGNYEPSNCRWTTKNVQCQNKRKHTRNKSGFIGVSWHKHRKKWRAYVSINTKQLSIGYFKDIQEAIRERNIYISDNNLAHSLNIMP